MSLLELKELGHSFPGKENLKGINFSLNHGESVTFVGPSGSGKSSLLKCIAGFWKLSHGEIELEDQVVARVGFHKPASERHVGFVFQEPCLFPHMTVQQNISFGKNACGGEGSGEFTQHLIGILDLEDLLGRYPSQLSGGQMQRVSLVRSLVVRPKLLLMDEPFSSLDESFVFEFLPQLRRLLLEFKIASIYVTHRLEEASLISDKIGILDGGVLKQLGDLRQVYRSPFDKTTAQFFGKGFFLPVSTGSKQWKTDLGPIQPVDSVDSTQKCVAFFRPEDVAVDQSSGFQVRISSKEFQGDRLLVRGHINDKAVLFYADPVEFPQAAGQSVGITLCNSNPPVYIEPS